MYQFFGALCFCCFIMFIVSMIRPRWGTFGKRPEWNRKKIATLYFALMIVFTFLSSATTPEDVKIAQQQAQEQKRIEQQQAQEQKKLEQQQKEAEKKLKERQEKDIFCKKFGMTLEQAQAIEDALNSVGLGEVKDANKENTYITLNVDATNKDYTPQNGAVKVFVDDNNGLQAIKIGAISLYENGQAVRQISDLIVSINEEIETKNKSKEIVKTVLKAPSTAKFDEDTFKYLKSNGSLFVIGTVDAQNSFGAMVREPFKVEYDISDLSVKSFTFEGKVLYQKQ